MLGVSFMASQPKDRALIAKMIATAQYLNQPEAILTQLLTGMFAGGLGNIKNEPDRTNSGPVQWQFMAVWMLPDTQPNGHGHLEAGVQPDLRQRAE